MYTVQCTVYMVDLIIIIYNLFFLSKLTKSYALESSVFCDYYLLFEIKIDLIFIQITAFSYKIQDTSDTSSPKKYSFSKKIFINFS